METWINCVVYAIEHSDYLYFTLCVGGVYVMVYAGVQLWRNKYHDTDFM